MHKLILTLSGLVLAGSALAMNPPAAAPASPIASEKPAEAPQKAKATKHDKKAEKKHQDSQSPASHTTK